MSDSTAREDLGREGPARGPTGDARTVVAPRLRLIRGDQWQASDRENTIAPPSPFNCSASWTRARERLAVVRLSERRLADVFTLVGSRPRGEW